MKRITVIGSGYVGLVSGAAFADVGHDVTAIDRDSGRIASLRAGEIPIFEPGLADIVHDAAAAGRLRFGTDLRQAVSDAEIVIVAVGTPSDTEGAADLEGLKDAVTAIAPAARNDAVLVIKSTVPVGTGDMVERIIRTMRPDCRIEVVSNPEFLREGAAIQDFFYPERVVIGTENVRSRDMLAELYRPLGEAVPLFFTTRRSAELLKYAANAFLAMKVSFINEIADLCEATGADVTDVAQGIGLDPRIGARYLEPGPGFGGSCFPKDTRALAAIGRAEGARQTLVEAAVAANRARRDGLADRVARACNGNVSGARIGVLGLTFKPDTDDLRDSPAIDLIASLQAAGALVFAYDPKVTRIDRPDLAGVMLCLDPYAVATNADCLVLATHWAEFRELDLARLAAVMSGPRLVDLRNVFTRADAEAAGFSYFDIGRTKDTGGTEPLLAAE